VIRGTPTYDADLERMRAEIDAMPEPEPDTRTRVIDLPPAPASKAIWTPAESDRFSEAELLDNPPPMRFAVYPYLPAGTAAVLTGAGGTSKTGLMVRIATSICTGTAALGDDRVEPGSVLFVSAEDRREILQRHVWAAVQGIDPHRLSLVCKRFVVKDAVGSGFTMTQSVTGAAQIAIEVGDLIEFARTLPDLRLVCLDTLSRLNGGDEMNEGLAVFIRSMERVSVATGAAVLVAHHTGKQQMRDGANDQYSGRGGSALSDNARSVLHLEVVKPGPGAPSNAVDAVAGGRLLRLSHVKSNYAAPAPDVYLQRVTTPYAAQLVDFVPDMTPKGAEPVSKTWGIVASWLRDQTSHDHPTSSIIEAELNGQVSRLNLRQALRWAEDSGLLEQAPHPRPSGARKTFYVLPSIHSAIPPHSAAIPPAESVKGEGKGGETIPPFRHTLKGGGMKNGGIEQAPAAAYLAAKNGDL
jgi:hypothetical protein